jgi:hypothetical protein
MMSPLAVCAARFLREASMKLTRFIALAVALVIAFSVAEIAAAQPVKGQADVAIMQPVTKVVGTEVVTTIKVKNLSKGPIAGLKVDEYWYDKEGNPMPGGTKQLSQPLAPGAVTTIVLKTKKDPKMDRNSYQFSHQNGTVKTRVVAKIE